MKICPKCGGRFGDEVQACPVDGTALVAEQAGSSGYKVAGRFLLGDLVERRSVGDIYAAVEDGTGRKVWTFFAGPHVVPSDSYRDQVLRELQVVAGISSPTLLPVLAQGLVEDGRIYVVTEAPSEPSLAAHVGSQGPLSVAEAAAMARDVATLLKEFQGRGVAHRDLSPSNVFLSSGGARILDLGVTTVLGNNVFGDPWFLSPEQAQGRPVDARANFYSLGALFYYAICGMPPYKDTDPATLVERHKSGGFEPPTRARADLKLPPEVDRIAARAMAVNPLARYFSFDEMIQEFSRLAGDARQSAGAAVASAPAAQPAAAPAAQPAAAAPAAQPAAVAAQASSAATPGGTPSPAASSPAASTPAASSPAPAANPSPTQSPQQATGQDAAGAQSAAAARRRRRKGGFRATMWFMKGEQIQQAAAQDKEEELLKVTAGDGTISDQEKDLMDRYRDDGSIKAEDRAKFSLRTGRTGMMQAVQIPESPPVGRTVDERGVVESLDRSRKVWVWLGILVVLLGIGAFVFFMYRSSIPASFMPHTLGTDLEKEVPSFEPPPPKIAVPSLPALPSGSLKELWDGLLKAKAEALLPKGAAGPGEYLVAFDGKLKELSQVKTKPRRRHRRRKAIDPLTRVFRRKAPEVSKQLDAIRKDVVGKLVARVKWVKGKIYEGQDTDKWLAAYRAGALLSKMSAVPNKDEIDGIYQRMVRGFFQKPAAPARPATPGGAASKSPLAALSLGMDIDKAIAAIECVKVERVLSGTKQTVTCKGKGWTLVISASPKDKKITAAKYLVGGKEQGHLGGGKAGKSDKTDKPDKAGTPGKAGKPGTIAGTSRPRARAR